MSSLPADRTTSRHRPVLAMGIVVLSIVIPIALVVGTALTEMRDKGVATQPSKTVRYYFGSVKQGELWHTEYRANSNPFALPSATRILRLNLETGEEHDPGLTTPSEFGWPEWIDGTLYFQTETAVYQQSNKQFVKLADTPPMPAGFYVNLFLYESKLTTIRPTDGGGYRLLHLSDGKWIDGRPILLPETTRTWHHDEQRDRTVLLPLTSQQPVTTNTPPPNTLFQVISEHLSLSNYQSFSAYRNGFEFADEVDDVASALRPENAPRDVTGWEPIATTSPPANECWRIMATSDDCLLFKSMGSPSRVARRNRDGSWVQSSGPIMDGVSWNGLDLIISDPNEATAYIMETDQRWGSAKIAPVKENSVVPIYLTIPGCEREYLARWKRLGVSLFVAWLLHIVILIGRAAWLTRGGTQSGYEFGNQQATLAPLWRRAIATGIDLVLVLTIAAILGRLLFAGLGFPELSAVDETQLAHDFFDIEQELVIRADLNVLLARWVRSGSGQLINQFLRSLSQFPDLILIIIAVLVILIGASVFLEGRHGVTPGKWLLGLRTVRTTLRSCGFARALVRNVLYYVDLPLLLTPLPAAVSLMFSDHRQRLGDRVADTIVVRAGSVREAC